MDFRVLFGFWYLKLLQSRQSLEIGDLMFDFFYLCYWELNKIHINLFKLCLFIYYAYLFNISKNVFVYVVVWSYTNFIFCSSDKILNLIAFEDELLQYSNWVVYKHLEFLSVTLSSIIICWLSWQKTMGFD